MCLLARKQLFEVVADTARGGLVMHPVPRTCAGMHAKAAVQAREMQSDGWPWMASREASVRPHVPSHGDVNHVPVSASQSVSKAGVLRMRHVGENPSQESTVFGHAEAWKLAEHELMLMPRVGERGCTRSNCNG